MYECMCVCVFGMSQDVLAYVCVSIANIQLHNHSVHHIHCFCVHALIFYAVPLYTSCDVFCIHHVICSVHIM